MERTLHMSLDTGRAIPVLDALASSCEQNLGHSIMASQYVACCMLYTWLNGNRAEARKLALQFVDQMFAEFERNGLPTEVTDAPKPKGKRLS